MPEFMVLIHTDEADGAALAPAETQRLLELQLAYEDELRARAAWLEGERLRPSLEARRVRRTGQSVPEVEMGPFPEATLDAYYVLAVDDLDAAVDLAREYPVPPGAKVEVRPVMGAHLDPEKLSQKGRVFAFGVLGAAPSEGAWIDIMDRIDERTRGQFPEAQFCGGARLEAPSRGRVIQQTGGRRAVLDGPFLESKEVIGGVFFLRLSSVDEAVEWAGQSVFLEHGVLEIRELWRS